MRRGGNAVDAALATAITLTVVEPNNNGVGSDAFAIVGSRRRSHGASTLPVDRRRVGRASASRGATQMPDLGWDSVTVPGAVSAWVALSERFGRLPFAQLFDAAIAYARDGFHVGPKTAYYWHLARRAAVQASSLISCAHFLPLGRAPRAGELFKRPELARTLELIAQSRGEAFYRGELAQRSSSQRRAMQAAR